MSRQIKNSTSQKHQVFVSVPHILPQRLHAKGGDLVWDGSWSTQDLLCQRKGWDSTRIPKFIPELGITGGGCRWTQQTLSHHPAQLYWWEWTSPQLQLPLSKVSFELLGIQIKYNCTGNRIQIQIRFSTNWNINVSHSYNTNTNASIPPLTSGVPTAPHQGEHKVPQELSGNTFVHTEGGRALNKNNKKVSWPRSG